MKKNLERFIIIYIFISIIMIPVLAITVNLLAVSFDVSLLFIVGSIYFIANRKKYRGLELSHLFLVVGIIELIISIILLDSSSSLAIFINKYGMILVPVSFIIVPIYTFALMPRSQYHNIIKFKYIEVTGKCIGYDYTSSRWKKWY